MRMRSLQGWVFGGLLALGGLAGCGKSDDGNKPPVPVISQPAEGTLFSGGQTLTVAASANDPEDGALTGTSLVWWAERHHDAHTHPFQQPTSSAGGRVPIPSRGEASDNIFYRLHLRATDSKGLSTEVGGGPADVTAAADSSALVLTRTNIVRLSFPRRAPRRPRDNARPCLKLTVPSSR